VASSTSSSRKGRSVAAYLAAFAVAFAFTALVIAALVASGLPHGSFAPPTRLPGREDAFFIYAGDDDLGHRVLWHGFGTSIEHARAADIVIVGDSRSQLGLREAGIEEFSRSTGNSVFHMGLGYGEQSWLPMKLIERHDLRPRVVIIAVSSRFFLGNPSRWASTVTSESRWDAWKGIAEKTLQWHVARVLHRVVPRYDATAQTLWGSFVFYRSHRTGSWIPVIEPDTSTPVRLVPRRQQVFEGQLEAAIELKEMLGRRGTRIVLTVIPNSRANYAHAEFLASALDVPLIAPRLSGLGVVDGVHLDAVSARRFSEAFWSEFAEAPAVRDLLAGSGRPERIVGYSQRR